MRDPMEDLPMDDLVELFRRQVNLHGVARFIPLLAETSASSTGFNARNLDENSNCESESVDIVSDSDFEDYDREDDDFDSDISVNESNCSSENESDDEHFGDEVNAVPNPDDMVYVHESPVFVGMHCPPYGSVEDTMFGVCDCCDFGMDTCAKVDGYKFFSKNFILYVRWQLQPPR
jgi:hypothetical protein